MLMHRGTSATRVGMPCARAVVEQEHGMSGLSDWWEITKQTFSEWSEDKVPRLAAALASSSLNPFVVPFHNVDDTGAGYCPGMSRPPAKRSNSPSPSQSANAIGPRLANSAGN